MVASLPPPVEVSERDVSDLRTVSLSLLSVALRGTATESNRGR